jgi:PAS domain S-box-containing protein
MSSNARPPWSGYLVAVVSVALAAAIRWILLTAAGTTMPLALFYVTILVTAWYGGYKPAWLALVAGVIPQVYFRLSGMVPEVHWQAGIAIYLLIGSTFILLIKAQTLAREAAERQAAQALKTHRLLEREVAERKSVEQAAEQQAKNSEARLMLALKAGRLGIWSWDLTTNLVRSSETHAAIHGRTVSHTDISIEECRRNIHPDDEHVIRTAMERAAQNEAPERITYRVLWPDGTTHWIEGVGRVFCDASDRPVHVMGVCTDITEQKLAYDHLQAEQNLLRNLIDVQEKEKQVICYDFHDGLIQYAFGAQMLLEAYRLNLPSSEGSSPIDEAIRSLGKGVEEGRRIIRGIRPTVLDDMGVDAAIHDLIDQYSSFDIAIESVSKLSDGRLPKGLEAAIYRVVQEALTNATKYSQTDRVRIELRAENGHVHLEVQDFGCGFNVESGRKRGFGLLGMTGRVRLLGGECSILSETGVGTRIVARIPILAANGEDGHA